MKKILLLTVGLFSISTAYSMCVPSNLPRCNCAFPKFENGTLSCGEDYCKKVGKTCMDDGSCCKTLDDEGSNCCDKTGKNKETGLCCEVLTQADCSTGIIDNQTTGCKECCPPLETAGCETEVDTETGCTVCKVAEISCETNQVPCSNGTDTWCCAEGNTCQDGKCCQGDTCCDEGEFAIGRYREGHELYPDEQVYDCCDGTLYITDVTAPYWNDCCPKGSTVMNCKTYCETYGSVYDWGSFTRGDANINFCWNGVVDETYPGGQCYCERSI